MNAVLKVLMGYFIAYMSIKLFTMIVMLDPKGFYSTFLTMLSIIAPIYFVVQIVHDKVYGIDGSGKNRHSD